MRNVADFANEMAIRLRMLGLLIGKHFTTDATITCADVARATQAAQTELAARRTQFEAELEQQLRYARSFSKAADYLQGKGTDLSDMPEDLRSSVEAWKSAVPATDTLEKTDFCDRARRTHHDCAQVLAEQRVYLERALSVAAVSIDDGRIAMLHTLRRKGDLDAIALLPAAYREREVRLRDHKAKFNGAGLAQQIQIEQARERQRSRRQFLEGDRQ